MTVSIHDWSAALGSDFDCMGRPEEGHGGGEEGLAATPPPKGLMFGEDRKGDDFCHPLFFGELAKIYSL